MAFRNIYSPAPSSFVPSIPAGGQSFHLAASTAFSSHGRDFGSTRSLDRRLLALNLDPDPARRVPTHTPGLLPRSA